MTSQVNDELPSALEHLFEAEIRLERSHGDSSFDIYLTFYYSSECQVVENDRGRRR